MIFLNKRKYSISLIFLFIKSEKFILFDFKKPSIAFLLDSVLGPLISKVSDSVCFETFLENIIILLDVEKEFILENFILFFTRKDSNAFFNSISPETCASDGISSL